MSRVITASDDYVYDDFAGPAPLDRAGTLQLAAPYWIATFISCPPLRIVRAPRPGESGLIPRLSCASYFWRGKTPSTLVKTVGCAGA